MPWRCRARNATLVEAKAIDGNYPLYGEVMLEGGMPLAEAVATRDGIPGAAADPLLMGRLGLKAGDRVKLGSIEVAIRALIQNEPDRLSDGVILGPRLLLTEETLSAHRHRAAGEPDHLRYRVKTRTHRMTREGGGEAGPKNNSRTRAGACARARNAAAGADGFVERLGYFMTLVGLPR